MAIVQLQSEFAAALSIAPPEYTWATKPSAAGNSGKRITITGWNAPASDWVSDGTYWLPVGGRAVVHAPRLVGAIAQHPSMAAVASVPTWQMPADMVAIPGLYIEANAECTVANASNVSYRRIYCGISSKQHLISGPEGASTNNGFRLWGKTSRKPDGNWTTHGANAQPINESLFGTDTSTSADLASSPIGMWYRGGNTDGSEILSIHSFSLAVGVG